MVKEFKEFVANGSVMDAAIGFVIGLAFKSVVDSVVNDILMPIVGFLTAGIDFTNLKIVLKQAVEGVSEEVAITYGQLIQAVISFLIISLILLFVMKAVNKLRRKKAAEEAQVEEVAPEETELELLKDFRQLLSDKDK